MAPVPTEILDQFVHQGPLTPVELDAAVRRFKKAIHRARLGRRADTTIWGVRLAGPSPALTNHRNGTSGKTVLTDDGPLAIEVPRDREGTFEPRLIETRAAFPPDIRRVLYTTNALESVHAQLRKILKPAGIFRMTTPRSN